MYLKYCPSSFYPCSSPGIIPVLMLCVLLGCEVQTSSESGTEIKKLKEFETIVSIYNNLLAIPNIMRYDRESNLIVYDAGQGRVLELNESGDVVNQFGQAGQGPGEIQSLTNYWIMNDHYLLYDYNGAKMIQYNFNGSFIDEYPVNIREAAVEALSAERFVYPANGEENSLLKLLDVKHNETVYIGEAVAGENESSNEEIRDIIRRGGVPNYMQNRVHLGVNESGIFSFQSTNAVLQKFSVDGEFLWEIDLNIPSVDGVFENYLKENREQDRYIASLTYARGMHVSENGAAVLLNTPDSKPTTVVWIPNDGIDIRVVEYPDIERHPTFPLRFSVAPGHQAIYFVHSLDGTVFRSTWPIDT